MKPNGDPISHSARAPPTAPYGIAANTISGLNACLNCTTSARKIITTDMPITIARLANPLVCSSCSPADFETIAWWKPGFDLTQAGHDGCEHFGREMP